MINILLNKTQNHPQPNTTNTQHQTLDSTNLDLSLGGGGDDVLTNVVVLDISTNTLVIVVGAVVVLAKIISGGIILPSPTQPPIIPRPLLILIQAPELNKV